MEKRGDGGRRLRWGDGGEGYGGQGSLNIASWTHLKGGGGREGQCFMESEGEVEMYREEEVHILTFVVLTHWLYCTSSAVFGVFFRSV